MKNTKMSLSEFRMKINTALLKRIGTGEEIYTITSHGFPIAQVTAIHPNARGKVIQFHGPDLPLSTPAPVVWTGVDFITPIGDDLSLLNTSATNTAADGRPILNPVPVPEPGQPIQWHDPKVTVDEFKQAEAEDEADIKAAQESLVEPGRKPWKEVREELAYETPLEECSIEMLETVLANTDPEELVMRARIMYLIREKRTFTATETEIYRQLMDQLKPDISGKYDGT